MFASHTGEEFLILRFRRVLYVVCFLLGIHRPAYEDGTDRVFRNVGY